MADKCNTPPTLAAVLSQLINVKPERRVIQNLLALFPTLPDLLDATEDELRAVSGIGVVKARQIISALNMARSICLRASHPPIVRSAKDIFDHLKVEMQYLPKEHFVVVGLDRKMHLLFSEVIAVGSLDAAIIHPREVFRPLLKMNADATIFIHNHPSGDPTPSTQDIDITRQLRRAGEILNVRVIDHIIIGFETYFSLAEQGYL